MNFYDWIDREAKLYEDDILFGQLQIPIEEFVADIKKSLEEAFEFGVKASEGDTE